MSARRLLLVLGLPVAGLALFAGGAWVGYGKGATNSFLLDAPARGSQLVSEIRMLERGRADELRIAKEIMLDGEIAKFGWFLTDGMPLLARTWPPHEEMLERSEGYMRRIAEHRSRVPFAIPATKGSQASAEVAATLRKYGWTEPGKSPR